MKTNSIIVFRQVFLNYRVVSWHTNAPLTKALRYKLFFLKALSKQLRKLTIKKKQL